MSTTIASQIDDQKYNQLDLITTTLSSFIPNDCENQTQSPLDLIEDRINVVVPYLVIIGMTICFFPLTKRTSTSSLMIGIIGNGLSVLTFSQRKLRTLSCGCYLLLLAICDTIGLLIMSRPYFFKQLNLVHHLNSSILCGLHVFLTKIFDELTPWLLVLVACNRLVLSRYPRKDQYFQTCHAALWSAFCLLIIIVLLNVHLLFGIRVGLSPLQPCVSVCGPLTKSPYYLFFYKNVSPVIDLSLSLIIPFCIVFIANIFILANVRRAKKKVARTRRRKRANRNARLSIVLLADLITFLIVSLPVLSVECIYRFTRTLEYNPELDHYISIAWIIANKVFYLNYSLSFYFYVLTSSYFRHHFLLAIRCKKLHGIIFQTTQITGRSDQATDFISKYRVSRISSASRLSIKNGDLNSCYAQQNYSEQPKDLNRFSNGTNQIIPLRQSHSALTAPNDDVTYL